MSDPELERIRAERLAQLKAQAPGFVSLKAKYGGEELEEQNKDQVALMEPSAQAYLKRIAVLQPGRAQRIEDIIVRMFQQGQLKSKVTEAMVDKLAEAVNDQYGPSLTEKHTAIKNFGGKYAVSNRHSGKKDLGNHRDDPDSDSE
eukprot:m.100254 g.100254  ORF g.100254 m.100254 type:complete len:145 (-) comp27230_c0_seq1:343-777(-)